MVIPVGLPHSIQHLTVIDHWLAPDYRYFKVHGDDDILYILRHDTVAGHWELTMYDLYSART